MNRNVFPKTISLRRFRRRKTLNKRRQIRSKRSASLNFEYYISDIHSSSSKLKSMNFHDRKIIPTWYWSNYYKALEWQNKHKVTLWKSYALALEKENKYLIDALHKLVPDIAYKAPVSSRNYSEISILDNGYEQNQRENHERDQWEIESEGIANEDEDHEITFEVSDEMIKFFEQSLKHKLDLKKSKEAATGELCYEIKELQESHHQRIKEMRLLYGDGSSMIAGMETAVQLSFDKYCDTKSPKYWPNIPLNL